MELHLEKYGFKYFGSCNCNGGHNKKYQRGLYMLYIGGSRFSMKKDGSTIKQKTNLDQLDEYLQSLIPTAQAV